MKTLIGFLAGGVLATLLVANMTGSFAPRLADQVAPIDVTTVSGQPSPEATFEDEPNETEGPDDHGGTNSGSGGSDDNSGPNVTASPDDHGGSNSGSDDNSGSGSDNSGSGSDNSGSGSDDSGSGSDDSSKTPKPTETPH